MDLMVQAIAEAATSLATTSSPGSAAAQAGADIARQLTQPLRVGVVGRVSSGKSTLVNALLEQAVAPTAAGECTRVPCWFQYGRLETASLQSPTMDPVPVVLTSGRLPARLPVTPADHSWVDVTLPLPLLRTMTIVDTPGLASATDGVSEQTAALMSEQTTESAGSVDALVVVLTGPLREDEAAAVAKLAASSPVGSAVAVAALTRVDQLAADPDESWKTGVDLAEELLADHRDLFSDVVPIAGLVAEAGATTVLDEHDARAIRAIAREVTPELQPIMLSDARTFTSWDLTVAQEHRVRLVTLLGLYGVSRLLDLARAQGPADAAEMTTYCLEHSGRTALVESVTRHLTTRSELLRAARAVALLKAACQLPGASQAGRDAVEAAVNSPATFRIRVHESLMGMTRTRTFMPAALAAQAQQARDDTLEPRTAQEAAADVAAWRSWAMLADGPGRQVADAVIRSIQLVTRSTR